jgi:hypothetical protein
MMFRLSPPAVIFERLPRGTNGKSSAFVVMLPHGYPAKMLVHELHHVKQWWFITLVSAAIVFAVATMVPFVSYYAMFLSVGVMGLLYRFSAGFRFKAEAAAYAAGFTNEPDELSDYAKALSSSLYSTGRTLKESRGAIASRFDDGRLF